MSVYTENGYKNRKDYLSCLADDWGVPVKTVHDLAGILGADEDFDGLVSAVESAADDAEWQAEHDSRGCGLYMGRFSEGSIYGGIPD